MEVVLIFDIGKTNKKILLFDRKLNLVHEEEEIFPEVTDDDGFACDDIDRIESWIREACKRFIDNPAYELRGINFTTYGATLMYLDGRGKRLTPVYNYLKPMPEGIVEPVYEAYGGVDEFCRKTASPALGMLNSGFQARWLKVSKPDVFREVKTILHLPQYMSYLLTGQSTSEHTSIGCHTALWDFDRMQYHEWTSELGNVLPDPQPVERTYPVKDMGREVLAGIGIHDSSASLVPYLMQSESRFILVSTGTWCISMNPFNNEPLTASQLEMDCLNYMSIRQEPVKSSRLFLGHMHDVNVKRMAAAFGVDENHYKSVKPDMSMITELMERNKVKPALYNDGIPEDYIDTGLNPKEYRTCEEAYHQLMIGLVDLAAGSIKIVEGKEEQEAQLFVTGGFSKNPLFIMLLSMNFPDKNVVTSEIPNSTSLGAAMVLWKALEPGWKSQPDLGLQKS